MRYSRSFYTNYAPGSLFALYIKSAAEHFSLKPDAGGSEKSISATSFNFFFTEANNAGTRNNFSNTIASVKVQKYHAFHPCNMYPL